MSLQFGPAASVGLRHVIEDGLTLLNRGDLAAGRRQIVLKGLMDIFSGASRGSEIMQAQSLFARASDKPAVEAFSLLFRYLNASHGANLPSRITEAYDVLRAMSEGQHVEAALIVRTHEILSALLVALRREIALKPPHRQQRYEMQ